MNHWLNEGKEILRQGRSKKQVEDNYKGCFISTLGLIAIIIIVLLSGLK